MDPRRRHTVMTCLAARLRAPLAVLAVAIAVAACGSGQPAPSPGATTSGAGTPFAPASPSATTGGAGPDATIPRDRPPSTTGGAGPSGTPSIPHDVPDLEALIPAEVAGAPLTKGSFGGERAASILLGTPAGQELLSAVVQGPDELSIATGANETGSVSIVRVAGQDPGRLLAAAVSSQRSFSGGAAAISDVTLGGKDVKRVGDPSSRRVAYIYSRGDMFLSVQSQDVAFVEDALRKLPAPDAGAPGGVSPEPSPGASGAPASGAPGSPPAASPSPAASVAPSAS